MTTTPALNNDGEAISTVTDAIPKRKKRQSVGGQILLRNGCQVCLDATERANSSIAAFVRTAVQFDTPHFMRDRFIQRIKANGSVDRTPSRPKD